MAQQKRIIALFDVDGTLTAPRASASDEMKEFLQTLRKNNIKVGIVGGSDLVKQKEQMGENIVTEVDYSFSENGLVAYKNGELIGKQVSKKIFYLLFYFYFSYILFFFISLLINT